MTGKDEILEVAEEKNRLPHGPLPPHRLVRDFLPQEMAEALLTWAIENEARFEPTKVGNGEAEREDSQLRVSVSIRRFGDLKRELRRRFLEIAPSLISTLRVNPLEIVDSELELVAHRDGAFYGRHIDTRTGACKGDTDFRFLSAVYYIHRRPKAFCGGALRLHRFGNAGADAAFLDIEPEHNALVAFPSWAAHEVRPIGCPSGEFAHSRFAVNIWLRAPLPKTATKDPD